VPGTSLVSGGALVAAGRAMIQSSSVGRGVKFVPLAMAGRGSGGRLTAEWRALFERYPDRFLLGSDTWINERWQSYGDIMAGYRAWLAQLPPKTAAQIAHGNARALFGP